MSDFVPLSVREGGMRKRLWWRAKGWREGVALRLAPWLGAGALAVSEIADLEDVRDARIRKWEQELSIREAKAGPGSHAALYAEGVLRGLKEWT